MRRANHTTPHTRGHAGEVVLTTFEAAATLTDLALDIAAAADDD